MSVSIDIPAKYVNVTKMLSFKRFSKLTKVLAPTYLETKKCKHEQDAKTLSTFVFASSHGYQWYNKYTYCSECLTRQLEFLVGLDPAVSFAVYKVDGKTIQFEKDYGSPIQISYISENAIKLWETLKTEPNSVEYLKSLITYYSS